ncbi:hypothetical protein AMECASPLE_006304 [Ameca splendens]|uniref:Uncharacterized protein n=1 Tax=Ameca splendens TaxID=208324 RepID=A0ABV0ZJ48_9TELE
MKLLFLHHATKQSTSSLYSVSSIPSASGDDSLCCTGSLECTPSTRCSRVYGSLHNRSCQNRCFVDLEKALSDHVPRGALWGTLQEYRVRGPLLSAIQSVHMVNELNLYSAFPVKLTTQSGLH